MAVLTLECLWSSHKISRVLEMVKKVCINKKILWSPLSCHCYITPHSQEALRRISADIISILILKELIKSHGDTKDPPGVQPSQRHRPTESQSQADHLKAIPNQKAAEQNKNVRLETIWTHKFIPQTLQSVLVVMKVTTLVQFYQCSRVLTNIEPHMFWEFAG